MALDGATWVIRQTGERTVASSHAILLSSGVPSSCVEQVSGRPFSQTLTRGLEAGLKANRRWTFCIDGDVLIRPACASRLLEIADALPEKTFGFQGFMLDKFTGSIRSGAVHCYRTRLISTMLDIVPRVQSSIRPETAMKNAMIESGYKLQVVPYVVGIHDFYQYSMDIYRKCFTHAHKHLDQLPHLVRFARSRVGDDPDFEMALRAYGDGLASTEGVELDVEFSAFLDQKQRNAPSQEGRELALSDVDVEGVLARWSLMPDVVVRGLPVSAPDAIQLGPDAAFGKTSLYKKVWRSRKTELGFRKAIVYALGSLLAGLGTRLKNRVMFKGSTG